MELSTFAPEDLGNVTAAPPDPQTELLNTISHNLVLYLTPVIVIVGTVGNALNFAVFIRRRMRSKSVYFYLLLLSCADTVILFTNALRVWYHFLTGHELYTHHSAAVCKIHMFVQGVMLHMSAWFIVLVTIDRFVAVTFPLRAASLCTGRRAALISLVTFLVVCVYHVHIFWTFTLLYEPRTSCTHQPHLPFMTHGYKYLTATTYSLIPFLLVLLLNISIVVQLKRRSVPGVSVRSKSADGSSKTLSGSKRGPGEDKNKELARLTTVLFMVSISWLILSLPFLLVQVLPVSRGTRLFMTIGFILLWINNAINFFLYCLSGQKLRSMIFQQIFGKCVPQKNAYVSTTRTEATSCV